MLKRHLREVYFNRYYGILLVLFVCSTQMYTASLLGKSWLEAEQLVPNIQLKNRYPYAALADFTYGKQTAKLVTILLDFTIFGAGVPNLIVASQNLQLLGDRLSNNEIQISFCYWMVLVGTVLCPLLWFGSPKDMKYLCTVSVLLVIMVFVLVFGAIFSNFTASSQSMSDPEALSWQKLFSAYGILTFQFDIHPTILTIQVDMQDKSKINKAIIVGFIISLGIFAITTISIVFKYGTTIFPNILDIFPSSLYLHVACFLVALQLGLSSAIGNSALYQHVEECLDIPRSFNHRRCLIRTGLTVFSVIIAESVPRFDLVMSLIGGALTGPLVFILPPLIYIKMLYIRHKTDQDEREQHFNNVIYDLNKESPLEEDESVELMVKCRNVQVWRTGMKVFFCGGIIVMGVIASIATTYWNVVNTIKFVTFTPPCIYNITKEFGYL